MRQYRNPFRSNKMICPTKLKRDENPHCMKRITTTAFTESKFTYFLPQPTRQSSLGTVKKNRFQYTIWFWMVFSVVGWWALIVFTIKTHHSQIKEAYFPISRTCMFSCSIVSLCSLKWGSLPTVI